MVPEESKPSRVSLKSGSEVADSLLSHKSGILCVGGEGVSQERKGASMSSLSCEWRSFRRDDRKSAEIIDRCWRQAARRVVAGRTGRTDPMEEKGGMEGRRTGEASGEGRRGKEHTYPRLLHRSRYKPLMATAA